MLEVEDPEFRSRMHDLKLRRNEAARSLQRAQKLAASTNPVITPDKIERVSRLIQDRLQDGPAEFRQAYVRLLFDEVRVTEEQVTISGSKAALMGAAEGEDMPPAAVLYFVQEWRARHDSNV